MQYMRTHMPVAVLVLGLTGALSGCGGGGSESGSGSGSGEPVATPAATAVSAGGTSSAPATGPSSTADPSSNADSSSSANATPATAVSEPVNPSAAPIAAMGRSTYELFCRDCHGSPPDFRVMGAAGDPAAILQAIAAVRRMNYLSSFVGAAQAAHLAAWLGDPR